MNKMPLFIILSLWMLLLTIPVTVYAQNITIPPVGAGYTCDLCGKCVGQSDVPNDYNNCIACSLKEGYKWTVFGCLPSSPGGFVQTMLKVITSIVGGIAFLAILYGGGIILTSSGNAERLEAGKSILLSAIVGILLAIFSVFILQFLGVVVFDLPGFGG